MHHRNSHRLNSNFDSLCYLRARDLLTSRTYTGKHHNVSHIRQMAKPVDEQARPTPSARGVTGLSPLEILRAARRDIPALRYAIGVAGIGVVAMLLVGLLGSPTLAIAGVATVLVLMTALFIFTVIARLAGASIRIIAIAALILLLMAFSSLSAWQSPRSSCASLGLIGVGTLLAQWCCRRFATLPVHPVPSQGIQHTCGPSRHLSTRNGALSVFRHLSAPST
jgi:hypothetical protein